MSAAPALESVAGRRVLFVMAARAEYGAALQARIRPLFTGIGPIEAAMEASVAMTCLQAAKTLPDLVVSLGSAGSRVLEQGRIYQASSISWRDIDASPLGFTKGVTPLVDHPIETPLPTLLPDVASARLSTGAAVVTGAGYDAIDAEMVDMETFAILRVAQRFAVPLIGLRGISDGAAELRHYDDWAHLLPVVDAGLADAVERLAAALAAASAS